MSNNSKRVAAKRKREADDVKNDEYQDEIRQYGEQPEQIVDLRCNNVSILSPAVTAKIIGLTTVHNAPPSHP